MNPKKGLFIKKIASFKEAEEEELRYYLNLTPEERLGIMQFLREAYFKLKGYGKNREGLRRVFKIIK